MGRLGCLGLGMGMVSWLLLPLCSFLITWSIMSQCSLSLFRLELLEMVVFINKVMLRIELSRRSLMQMFLSMIQELDKLDKPLFELIVSYYFPQEVRLKLLILLI